MALVRRNILSRLLLSAVLLAVAFLASTLWSQSVSATGGSRNRPPYNTAETNSYNRCANEGWQALRYGAIWVTNGSYYAGSVNIAATDNTSSVRIRGSVFGCHNTSANNTYALNISPQGANGWRLTNLSGTALYRGQSQGAHNWSTQGGEISANLNVSGLAVNNQNGPDTQTINIDLYRCFSTNASSATGTCYAETIPITVTRAARPQNPPPRGNTESATCPLPGPGNLSYIQGWGADTDAANSPAQNIDMYHVYVDGPLGVSGYGLQISRGTIGVPATTNFYSRAGTYEPISREDVSAYLRSIGWNVPAGWRHYGFNISIEPFRDYRTRSFYTYALNNQGGQFATLPSQSRGPCQTSCTVANPGVIETGGGSFTSQLNALVGAGGWGYTYSATMKIIKSDGTTAYMATNTGGVLANANAGPSADNWNIGSLPAEQYTISVTYTSTDPTANLGNPSCTSGLSIVTQPYLHIYGGDVQAGSGFGEDCSVSNVSAEILTFNRGSSGSFQGAGTHMAAFALGEINGFASNNGGATAKSLSFSNTVGNVIYGGEFGQKFCAADYNAATTGTDPGASRDFSGAGGNGTFLRDGDLAITSTSVPNGNNTTVYVVDGDATIVDNIVYTGSGSWANLGDIPSFYLIVNNGNIYIDRSVTRLDGVFIAKGTGAKGTIYTCTSGSNPYGSSIPATAAGCNNTLTINGAFIARQVKFLRTIGTISQAAAGDTVTAPHIAEIFVYGPEIWAR